MGRVIKATSPNLSFVFTCFWYALIVFGDYLLTQSYYDWHVLPKLLGFLTLEFFFVTKVDIKRLQLVMTLYLATAFCIFSISYSKIENDFFLFYVNLARLFEIFFGTMAMQLLIKKMRTPFKVEWRSLFIIILIGVAFIGSVFDFFTEKLQFIILIRMIQTALLAIYVLFKKYLHWTLYLWIFALVGADFLAGLRITKFIPSETIAIQHALQYFSFFFFTIGVSNSLTNQTIVRYPKLFTKKEAMNNSLDTL